MQTGVHALGSLVGSVGAGVPSGGSSVDLPGDAPVVQALLSPHDDVEPPAEVIRLHVHNLDTRGGHRGGRDFIKATLRRVFSSVTLTVGWRQNHLSHAN